jgi:hypothetical protein
MPMGSASSTSMRSAWFRRQLAGTAPTFSFPLLLWAGAELSPAVIAGLVKAQAPAHVACRAQEFVEFDGIDSKMIVQCSCNVRLSLAVPRSVELADPIKPAVIVKPSKAAPDES